MIDSQQRVERGRGMKGAGGYVGPQEDRDRETQDDNQLGNCWSDHLDITRYFVLTTVY